MMQAAPPPKVRRLSGKQAPGAFLVAVAAAVVAAGGDFAMRPEYLDAEDLEPEAHDKQKRAYLVTFPHPRALTRAGIGLLAPENYTHAEILALMLDTFANPEYIDAGNQRRTAAALVLWRLGVFREAHKPVGDEPSHAHYHVAVVADRSFRFAPYKRRLLTKYKLASHWSCSHEGYHTAIAYCVRETPKKQSKDLDPAPWFWQRVGKHPPALDAAQAPNTAEAFRVRRESRMQAASAEAKPEPRAQELDLVPIIISEKIKNTPDDPWASERLIKYLKAYASPQLYNLAWKLRNKLGSIIDDAWAWETVEETLAFVGQTRFDRLRDVARSPCVCMGQWRLWADWSLNANGINAPELCADIARALRDGRREDLPIVVFMGVQGGEGKSFLLSPLTNIYGAEYIQGTPEPNQFPLVGLEKKRIVLLNEWPCDDSVVPWSTQLMWFEGKDFTIMRPQNKNDYSGHLLYRGTAPIFVTCAKQDLGPVMDRAQVALALGQTSQDTMLARRLKVYTFSVKLPIPKGYKVQECGCCFARMVFEYAPAGGFH